MSDFIVKQLAVGGFDDNFSYIIHSGANGDTAVVDPCGDVEIIRKGLQELGKYQVKYILLTHGHHDHTSNVEEIKSDTSAPVAGHEKCTYPLDLKLSDRQQLPFGNGFIECLYSPGHTRDGVLYRLSDDSALFTGDTLFIDWCGYCTPTTMYQTMREVIFPLADSNIVYSGHNYGREPFGSLGVEKRRNPYLAANTFEKFQIALRDL